MSIVEISHRKLFEEIAEKLSIETPPCEVTVAAEGWFLAYIDLQVPRDCPMIETVRCWGGPSPDVSLAKEDAAREVVQKIKSEFELHIRDANYEEYIFYKNLYDHVAAQHSDLLVRFNNLEREYTLLKSSYVAVVCEKTELVADWAKMRHTIDEYRMTIHSLRAEQLSTPPHASEAGSAS